MFEAGDRAVVVGRREGCTWERGGPVRGACAQALGWAGGRDERDDGSGALLESVDGEGWPRGDLGGLRSRGSPAGAVPPRRLLRGVAGAIVVGGGCGQLGSSESAWALRWRGFASVDFGGEGRRFYSSEEASSSGGASLRASISRKRSGLDVEDARTQPLHGSGPGDRQRCEGERARAGQRLRPKATREEPGDDRDGVHRVGRADRGLKRGSSLGHTPRILHQDGQDVRRRAGATHGIHFRRQPQALHLSPW